MQRSISVSVLTHKIKNQLADFGSLVVVGELSRVQVAGSGHCYCTLKDADAVLSAVMWRNTLARHGPVPPEGTRVEVHGKLDVYPPRGNYQLMARKIAPLGAGDLAARFEELKRRLTAEGLFADERKRELPYLPATIGLATAAGSAALADLVHSIRARYPHMPIIHEGCAVQGRGAAAGIAAALAALDARDEVEVIVVGRGGGSLEDLWAFNEEPVVRAIAACTTPVISAVGHETDTTLADLAADLRAKTPTAAGELVVPVEAELYARLTGHRRELDRAIDELVTGRRDRLAALTAHRALVEPAHRIRICQQRLDDLEARADRSWERRRELAGRRLLALERRLGRVEPVTRLVTRCERLAHLADRLHAAARGRARDAEADFRGLVRRLEALSPLGVIERGYAVVQRADDGALVRRLADAPSGTAIRARLADGWLRATTDGGEPRRLREALACYDPGPSPTTDDDDRT